MNGSANIEVPAGLRLRKYHFTLFALALLFCTSLRVSLLFIYPVLVLVIFYGFNWKLDRNAVYLFVFVLLSWLISWRNGFFIKYNLVSFYYFIPFVWLLFAMPRAHARDKDYLHVLMNAITAVMIVNNIFGVFQYIKHPYDDSFEGLYGTFTVSQNGLSLVNAVLFFYHITMYQHRKKTIFLLFAGFFIISSVMGFYGAGLIAFIGAIILTYLRLRLRNLVILGFSLILIIGVAYLVMKVVSPLALDYNVNIIKKFLDPAAANAPRKLIIFRNYYSGYTQDAADLLLGSGPGTFNSRTAFMVGSPTYFQVDFMKSAVQPPYFRDYAYPLWNASNTGPYDGFMNQPFTSLLALLGEYGLLFTLGMVYVLARRYKNTVKAGVRWAKEEAVSAEFKMYRFATIFAILLLVIDNYMEYPEITALFIIIAKLSQQKMTSVFTDGAQS